MQTSKEEVLESSAAVGDTEKKSVKNVESAEKIQSQVDSPLKTPNAQKYKIMACRVELNCVSEANVKAGPISKSSATNEGKEKIYDYSSDSDTDKVFDQDKNAEEMQHLFKKLALEKKIKFVKYKPKAVKKKMNGDKTVAARKKLRNTNRQMKKTQKRVKRLIKLDSNENNVENTDNFADVGANIEMNEENYVSDGKNGSANILETENTLTLLHGPSHQSTPISMPLQEKSVENSERSISDLSSIALPCLNLNTDSNFDDTDLMPGPSTAKSNSAVPVQMWPTINQDSSPFAMEMPSRKIPSPVPSTSKDFQVSVLSIEESPRNFVQSTAGPLTLANKENSISMLKKAQMKINSPMPGTSNDFENATVSMEEKPKQAESVNHCSILSSKDSILLVITYPTAKKESERTQFNNITDDHSASRAVNIQLPDSSTVSNTVTSNRTIKSSTDFVLQNYFGFDDRDEVTEVNESRHKGTIFVNNNRLSQLRRELKEHLQNRKPFIKKTKNTKPETVAAPSTSLSDLNLFRDCTDNQQHIHSFSGQSSASPLRSNETEKGNACRIADEIILEFVVDSRKVYKGPGKQCIVIDDDDDDDEDEAQEIIKRKKLTDSPKNKNKDEN